MFPAFTWKAKAAGFVLAVFSFPSISQEVIERGNQITPHALPSWWVRMAAPSSQLMPELDSFTVSESRPAYYGKPQKYQPTRIVCGATKDQQGAFQWRYCDI